MILQKSSAKLEKDSPKMVSSAWLNESQGLKVLGNLSSISFDSKLTYTLFLQLLVQQRNLQRLRLPCLASPPKSFSQDEEHIPIPLVELGQVIPSWCSLEALELYNLIK